MSRVLATCVFVFGLTLALTYHILNDSNNTQNITASDIHAGDGDFGLPPPEEYVIRWPTYPVPEDPTFPPLPPTPTPEPVRIQAILPAPTPRPAPPPPPLLSSSGWPPAVEQWRPLVASYFPADQVETALCIIKHESGGNIYATGGAGERGLFQVHPTHIRTLNAMGYSWDSMYDSTMNVQFALYLSGGYMWLGPWAAQRWNCNLTT